MEILRDEFGLNVFIEPGAGIVRRAGIIEANSTPLLRTTTEVQNPSELAAVVSFRDDDTKWGRIEVRWWVGLSPLNNSVCRIDCL